MNVIVVDSYIFLVWPSADPEIKILYEIKRHKINKIYTYTRTIS